MTETCNTEVGHDRNIALYLTKEKCIFRVNWFCYISIFFIDEKTGEFQFEMYFVCMILHNVICSPGFINFEPRSGRLPLCVIVCVS